MAICRKQLEESMRILNPVCIYGKIGGVEPYEKFTVDLRGAIQRSRRGGTITFCFNSSGGDTNAGLGMFDLITACNRKTVALVVGRAESAAALLVQACKVRIMSRHSTMLVHSSHVSVSGSVENARTLVERFGVMDEYSYAIFAHRTGRHIDEIRELAQRDAVFNADEALEYGLVDTIL